MTVTVPHYPRPQTFPRRAVCFLVRPSQDGWVRSGRLAGLGSGAGTCCTDPIACSDVRQTKIAVDLSSLGVRRRRALNQRALAERRPGCPKANRVPTARTSPPILRSSACTCSTCTQRLSRSRIGGTATPYRRRRCSCDQHLAQRPVDAEWDGDSELVDFFRRAEAESRKGAEHGQAAAPHPAGKLASQSTRLLYYDAGCAVFMGPRGRHGPPRSGLY